MWRIIGAANADINQLISQMLFRLGINFLALADGLSEDPLLERQ